MIIRLRINKIDCEIREEDELTIIQACGMNGIEIPRFCYHEKLSIAGNCRMCLVYVTNEEKLLAACGIPIDETFDDEGIETEIDEILKAREGVLEFLLINHPLDCPICDQGGECDLQEQAFLYGIDTGRFYVRKRAVEVKEFGYLIKGIMTRCIHCTRCVRFLTEVAGTHELGILGRGNKMEIGTYKEDVIIESELSGNIIDLCPVGALTSKQYAYKGRPWEIFNVKGIDIHDSILTPITYQVKGGIIHRVLPRKDDNVNEEWISDKVRFNYESYNKMHLSIEEPMLKVGTEHVEISWKVAMNLYMRLLLKAKSKIDVIVGSKINNTTINVYKQIMNRLGSKNYIMENHTIYKKYNYDLRENFLNKNDLRDIEGNDTLLLCGINLRIESPILNIKIRNLNFGEDQIEKKKTIGIIGSKYEWRSDSKYIGSSLNSILKLLEGRLDYCKILKKSKNPLMIVGPSLLARMNITMKEIREKLKKIIKEENILIINYGGNTALAFEQGFFKENYNSNKENKVVLAIDSTEININEIEKKTVIFQGILPARNLVSNIDLMLPVHHYFEDFKKGTESYLDIFGKKKEVARFHISKKILRLTNYTIGYVTYGLIDLAYGGTAKGKIRVKEREIEDINVDYMKMEENKEERKIKINKNITLNNMIKDYYSSDINTRSSQNLRATGQGRNEKQIPEIKMWKKKRCI